MPSTPQSRMPNRERTVNFLGPRPGTLVRDAFDLVHGVGLAVDGQQRRRLGEVDGAYCSHHLGADAYGFARAVGCGRGQLVLAVRQLFAIAALAVPDERLIVAGVDRKRAG